MFEMLQKSKSMSYYLSQLNSYFLHFTNIFDINFQYIFVHDALVEAIEAGETHINKACLPRYIHSLQCIDVTDEKNHPPKVLEKQYRVSPKIGAKSSQTSFLILSWAILLRNSFFPYLTNTQA
jgi:hypothetical protein